VNFKTIINILAALLMVMGLSMLFPLIISYLYSEPDFSGHLKSSVLCLLVGLPLWFITRKSRALSSKDGFTIVSLAWLLVALTGAFPFYFTDSISSFTDAWFESMSGVTTTGSTILIDIESLPHGVLFWRSFLQWIGGMGIIVFTIAILPLLGVGGVQLFKAEVPGPVADKIRPRVKETAKILWMVYIGFTIVETILLSVFGMPLFDAVCHSFTTMPTGGFSTQNASIGAYDSVAIHYTVILFMFIAGANFTLHFRALSGNLKGYIRDSEFLTYFGIIMIATLLIFINVTSQNNNWSHDSYLSSLFQTVSIITTTGYGTADYELWPFFSQFLIIILMFVGGMGGSTGGGMKVARVILLIKFAATETRRMLHSRAIIPIRIGSRFISEDVIRNTLGFFLIYISIFTFTTLTLTLLNLDFESAFGAAASAIGNIGPGLGAYGPTDNYSLLHPFGKWMLSFCMLLGRLEIFTIMVLFSRTFWK
jgi:trk system potassium uptake protein TrkH|tara:strand:- start:791 stop:2230 length:1440 start_codon:yes stop_codon:yes gene_type:complete